MTDEFITQSKLHECIDYNPETGKITVREQFSHHVYLTRKFDQPAIKVFGKTYYIPGIINLYMNGRYSIDYSYKDKNNQNWKYCNIKYKQKKRSNVKEVYYDPRIGQFYICLPIEGERKRFGPYKGKEYTYDKLKELKKQNNLS